MNFASIEKTSPTNSFQLFKKKERYNSDQVICRMAEYDLACNLTKGKEYTGFEGFYNDSMMKKGHVSEHGHVYDISKNRESRHILDFLKKIEEKEDHPDVIMTSGTFFSMNNKLRKLVVKYLITLSNKGNVTLYVGLEEVNNLFKNSNVQVIRYNMKDLYIPHFIKTKRQFNFVLPHTEKKIVRVDINSDSFEPQITERILEYFDKLIADFKTSIAINKGMGN